MAQVLFDRRLDKHSPLMLSRCIDLGNEIVPFNIRESPLLHSKIEVTRKIVWVRSAFLLEMARIHPLILDNIHALMVASN